MRLVVLLLAPLCFGADSYVPEPAKDALTGSPFDRYYTEDAFHRRITFYMTGDSGTRLPLVVSILGSGAHSNFVRRDGQLLDAHLRLREAFQGVAHVLVVEKPGIPFGFQPTHAGTAEGSSEEFRREYTLDRWSEAVSAALRAARSLPGVDASKTLVLGHSEGGLVASRIAVMNPFVTHVATLAGGGPTRLFTLMQLVRAGYLYQDASQDPRSRLAQFLSDWSKVEQDPENWNKDFLGHPFRAWTSFVRTSCAQELSNVNARIYIAQGTEDHNVIPAAFDVLYAELLAHKRDVTAELIPGADHGFNFPREPNRDGQAELFARLRAWFSAGAHN